MSDVIIALGALTLLMVAAYRGQSVILFAPLAAVLAMLLTDAAATPAVFSELFMGRMTTFLKLYLPVFLLGALFGKLIEMSGFSIAIVQAVIRRMGPARAIPAVVFVCALLTYGGVSLFVVVFAVYPFAAQMFRLADIPKRLIPGGIALGAFTFTMDSLPGTPQIQNIIPTAYFGTSPWAAPLLGCIGGLFILITGLAYLEHARRRAAREGEGYGTNHLKEPLVLERVSTTPPLVAILPLAVVAIVNLVLSQLIPAVFPPTVVIQLPGLGAPLTTNLSTVTAVWAVEGALIAGILTVLGLAFSRTVRGFKEQAKEAVSGALLASINTASEYGFGAVIAALPGFLLIRKSLEVIPHPLVNEAVSITTLAGMTGSASGGLSLALAAMSDHFLEAAQAAGISPDVLHRVAAMASGGMDTLPHNGAVITLLAVTGLTHRQAYGSIFVITCIKTLAVFVVIAIYAVTGLS